MSEDNAGKAWFAQRMLEDLSDEAREKLKDSGETAQEGGA